MELRFIVAKIIEKLHIAALKNCDIMSHSKVCSGSRVYDTHIDSYTYIGSNCTIINTSIGKFCSIADGCVIGGPQHNIDYVSTSPVFHAGANSLKTNFSNHPAFIPPKTIIENDVWIGNNVLIKGGCKIGNGAVIGMGSVVTHDVPAYEIWAGNPARCIKKRFENTVSDYLLESEWWNWDIEKVKKYAQFFNSPEEFLKNIDGENK